MKKSKKHKIKHGYVPYDNSPPPDINWEQVIINPPLPKLKFSTESVTLRMPVSLLQKLKMRANEQDVPYQSLMKMLLSQALEKNSLNP